MEDKLKLIEMLFDFDSKVKDLLYNVSSKRDYISDDEAYADYVDYVSKALEEIDYYLYRLTSTFRSYKLKEYAAFIDEIKQRFVGAMKDRERLKKFCSEYLFSMRLEFRDAVGASYSGYSIFSSNTKMQAISINEYLHDLHVGAMNDEHLYRDIPVTETIKNGEGNVSLRGLENEVAKNIYAVLVAMNLPSRNIDIVSLENRIILMARDIGHATTVEISFKDGFAIINYFIPKVCNYDMVNSLPGVSKVEVGAEYAKGIFEVPEDSLAIELGEFLSMIPRDEHENIPGGAFYEKYGGKFIA